MGAKHIKVLLIDDNPGDIRLIQEMLKEGGVKLKMDLADRLSTGLEHLMKGAPDVILLDLGLPDSQGFDTFKRVHTQVSHVPIIVLTGLADKTLALKAVREGAQDYLVKSRIDNNLLVRAVRYAIERKRVEKALLESQRTLEAVVETAPSLIVLTDPEGQILLFNRACEELTGYKREEVLGKTIPELFLPPEWIPVVQKRFADPYAPEVQAPHENPWKTKSGKERPIEWRCTVLPSPKDGRPCILGTGIDITERKRAEKEMAELQEQLRQSQRMEAIGQLAGGVAHDFNNLLTIIKGNSQLSLMGLKGEDPSLRRNIEEIMKATDRASGLIRQLLAFSRSQVMEMKVIDLNMLITDLDTMLRRVIGEDIELAIQLAEDVGRVRTDPGQIEQVILNLAVNARDAMSEGGKLIIKTQNVEIDEDYVWAHVGVTSGSYAMLSITDTGCGMTPEVKDHLFEPFFTTKEVGKGTGLGLSTAYGIVKQSRGNICAYSEPGRGTTFKIYLPRVDEPLKEMSERVLRKESPRGNETILIVEDQEEVRKLTVQILRRQGYTVFEASHGEEAMRVAQGHAEEGIDLLLTDVVMPGMSGRELAEKLGFLLPKMKVLYMSGYTDDAIVRHGVLEEGVNCLQKPFTLDSLARKVREVLDK
jgi:PAS domain S-box-containing protein